MRTATIDMPWILVSSKVYNVQSKITIYEVRCPRCGHCETFSGINAPDMCYVCEEKRTMPEV